MEQEYVIALGSNLGSDAGGRRATLGCALRHLAEAGVRPRRVSRFFATPCFPKNAGPDYVNAAAVVSADLEAADFLLRLHETETFLGRSRAQRWGSRSLDLDLLGAGNLVLPDADTQTRWRLLPEAAQIRKAPEQLILPHPRLQDRAFVLVPLGDVAADWTHPILRRNVAQMLRDLPEEMRAEVRPLP